MRHLHRRAEAHSALRAEILLLGLLLILPISPAGATVEEGPIVTTVNGVDLEADEGHRLDGCTLEISVSGLAADPAAPVDVTIRIDAIAPTTAEGTTVALVDDGHETITGQLARAYDMTDRLADLDPKTNGYRLSVTVDVAGESQGTKEVWLACGAAQDGRPSRILFAVRWLGPAGQPIVGPLDALMPTGWRSDFEIRATSLRGTAICTVPAGSDELVCRYDNPGHGSGDGLVVPGGKRHTYDVAQSGLPPGWEVDGSTVGTFLGRETCPASGCGGDSGGHDDGGSCSDAIAAPTASLTADAAPCRHVVVNRLVAAPVAPPADPVDPVDERRPLPPPPPPAQVLASTGTAPPTAAARPLATLPATGPGAAWLATPAALSVAAGLFLTVAARTRVGTNQRDDR